MSTSEPVSDLDDPTRLAWHRAGAMLTDMMTPTLRLGVTGLSRAGKTIFITALIRNLVSGGRLPFFMPEAEGRIERAYLEPQPDDEVPRFDYEAHLDAPVARSARVAGEHAPPEPGAHHHRVQVGQAPCAAPSASRGSTSTSSTIPASG